MECTSLGPTAASGEDANDGRITLFVESASYSGSHTVYERVTRLGDGPDDEVRIPPLGAVNK